MTAAEVLEAAADYIDEHGWCQNYRVDRYGGVCALGGIWAITDAMDFQAGNDLATKADTALCDAVGQWIGHWNDAPGRTKDEVVRKLREVAASLAGPMAPPAPVREEEEEVEEPEPVAA